MGRWEPDARGRLARAALRLSAARGYEETTVADIAAAAGVTERTFYRYFPDKADAFFPDNAGLLVRLADVTHRAVAKDGAAPLDAVLAAVVDLAGIVDEEPERVLLAAQVVPTVPALAGRDLLRQQQITGTLAEALTEQGVPALQARLAAETGLVVWRSALVQWVHDPGARSLGDVVTDTAAAVRAL